MEINSEKAGKGYFPSMGILVYFYTVFNFFNNLGGSTHNSKYSFDSRYQNEIIDDIWWGYCGFCQKAAKKKQLAFNKITYTLNSCAEQSFLGREIAVLIHRTLN